MISQKTSKLFCASLLPAALLVGEVEPAFAVDKKPGTILTQRIQTTKEDFARWRFSRTIQFNTSASGANVAGDVRNFPVAVALTATDFDFSQAKPDGADIRFTSDPDAAPLPHSIEHWDAAAKSALVWVKLPVVRGNSAEQRVFLHWGNADATSLSDSTVVFDTRDGFVGAWHLGDSGGTAEGGFRDSTANAAHGTGVNLQPGARADGPLGRALSLRHAETQWVKVDGEKRKLFDLTNSLTFSIWAKAHSYANKGDPAKRMGPGYETIFAKGDNSWRLQKFGIRNWHKPPAELIEICVEKAPVGDLCVVGQTDMTTNQWFHLVGVHEHPQARLYVNGVLDKAKTYDVPWKSDDHPVGIGNQSQFPQRGRSWDGVLDEARVLSVVKDEHWIRLDYESQRARQKFLTFGETRKRL
ncbi:MAG: DUF2341 domain-containing protein [Verrucomicrobia bacterium]|nr:DUF2341 domain-containing protein [Verrucomicrobiota bacterium]